jgi:hypothetical protein
MFLFFPVFYKWCLELARSQLSSICDDLTILLSEEPESSKCSDSTEVDHTIIPQSENYETVSFHDLVPPTEEDYTGGVEQTRNLDMSESVQLTDWFCRPVEIKSYQWTINTPFDESFNPWKEFFVVNTRNVNRISNYKLLTADLHLKFLINGTPFHYGRLLVSYLPLAQRDQITKRNAWADNDLVHATQRPHLFLNPTESQGGAMKLPLFIPENAIDITKGPQGFDDLGEITLYDMSTLLHANGGTTPVSVTVMAWAENVKLSIPTAVDAAGIVAQSDEYGTSPVSNTAFAVAKYAGMLAKAPIIGAYARATEMAAGTVGSIARLFGFSRPAVLDANVYRPTPKWALAATNVPDDTQKLTVDCKQELTVDPKTTGIPSNDELTLNYIASKESWIYKFPFNTTQTDGTRLFSIVVDPCVHREEVSGGNGTRRLYLPACCVASFPFEYWRGTMVYRFMVVASKFHRGRIKVVWEPSGDVSTEPGMNEVFTKVVDIADTLDFEVEVGWGQTTSYRRHVDPSSGEVTMFNVDSITTLDRSNGVLAVYVINDLVTPATSGTEIDIHCFVKVKNDLAVADPNSDVIGDLRITDSENFEPLVPQSEEILVPQSEDLPPVEEANAPEGAPALYTFETQVGNVDNLDKVFFGETISSFRQLLKRYNRHEVLYPFNNEGTPSYTIYSRRPYPFYGGYTTGQVQSDTVPVTVVDGTYARSWVTLLNYLGVCYGGYRGSIRYFIDASTAMRDESHLFVERNTDRNLQIRNNTQFVTDEPFARDFYNNLIRVGSHAGSSLTTHAVNNTISAEIPYYEPYRFTQTKRLPTWGNALARYEIEPFIIRIAGRTNTAADIKYLTTWAAAGEDFNLFWYLGPPIYYVEGTMPAPP